MTTPILDGFISTSVSFILFFNFIFLLGSSHALSSFWNSSLFAIILSSGLSISFNITNSAFISSSSNISLYSNSTVSSLLTTLLTLYLIFLFFMFLNFSFIFISVVKRTNLFFFLQINISLFSSFILSNKPVLILSLAASFSGIEYSCFPSSNLGKLAHSKSIIKLFISFGSLFLFFPLKVSSCLKYVNLLKLSSISFIIIKIYSSLLFLLYNLTKAGFLLSFNDFFESKTSLPSISVVLYSSN